MRGLYIHIPFCLSKCAYCDFNSYADKWHLATDYVSAVLKEAEAFAGQTVDTVYIGGGTPTALPEDELCRLIGGIKKVFEICENSEFTVEMNPETAQEQYLKKLKMLGVNRISMGAQSFDDGLLKTLGRVHNAEKIGNAVMLAEKAGFENISLDLMFSLPGQTTGLWMKTLEKAVECNINHISCYGLKIEEGTPFYQNGVQPLSDELDREMYHRAISFLEAKGFKQYEISNFAMAGKESRHNLKYWHCEEYFGLGAGAHGYLSITGQPVRSFNVSSVEEYIRLINDKGNAVCEKNVLSEDDIKTEKIIMGLRLSQGIEESLVKDADMYVEHGFMNRKNGRIFFTEKGFDVSNEILSRII